MSINTVLLWESTRREIREAIDDGTLRGAIVPTGSTEQHNEHLAIIHDTASAVHIAKKAALKLFPQVTVATPIAIGVSEHWMDHKGTLTLRPEIFAEVPIIGIPIFSIILNRIPCGGTRHAIVLFPEAFK